MAAGGHTVCCCHRCAACISWQAWRQVAAGHRRACRHTCLYAHQTTGQATHCTHRTYWAQPLSIPGRHHGLTMQQACLT